MNFGNILRCFEHIGSIYKIEPLLHFNNKVLFARTSYTKMFGSNERLIQFWLSLHSMLLFPLTPLRTNMICHWCNELKTFLAPRLLHTQPYEASLIMKLPPSHLSLSYMSNSTLSAFLKMTKSYQSHLNRSFRVKW